MLTQLFGKNFVSSEDWSNDQLEPLLEMGADLKLCFAIGEPHNLMTGVGLGAALAHPKRFERMPRCLDAAQKHAVDYGTRFEVIDDMDQGFQDADMPFDRGCEAADVVVDGSQPVIYAAAENRLHLQKAMMALTLSGRL